MGGYGVEAEGSWSRILEKGPGKGDLLGRDLEKFFGVGNFSVGGGGKVLRDFFWWERESEEKCLGQRAEGTFSGGGGEFRVEFGLQGEGKRGAVGAGSGGPGGGPGPPGRGLRGARGHPGRKEVILQEEPGSSRGGGGGGRGGGGRFGSARAGLRDRAVGARAGWGGVLAAAAVAAVGPPRRPARPGRCWPRSQTAGPGRNSRHSLCLSCQ